MSKIELLRNELAKRKLDAFIVPSQDEYLSEYVPDCFRRLEWLTGFSGSAGLAIVTQKKAAFFTDGRYTVQAKHQLSDEFEIYNSGNLSPAEWLEKNVNKKSVIAYDPKIHSESSFKNYKVLAKKVGFKISPVKNLVDVVWKNKPSMPKDKIFIQDIKYAGQSSEDKRKHVIHGMKKKSSNAAIITSPDSICWLLNIRGKDVARTPLVLSYLIIKENGEIALFVNPEKADKNVRKHLGKNVEILPVSDLEKNISQLKNKRVLIDPSSASTWFFDLLRKAKAKIIDGTDPCVLPKACKNKTEIAGTRNAHIRDGAALVKFFVWLEKEISSGKVTEISAAKKLEIFRAQGDLFKDLSFDTIAGYKANGAIVHYRADEKSNLKLQKEGMFLLDSGAQYLDGTTDVTRTISLGKPTKEQKQNFTRVLKGHIAIARAVFPEVTRGCDLDILARKELWRAGLDYDHGTGHGVGSYLSVHEGPQGISKRNTAELKPGMIISNEPGYYKEGEYGIRIENLVLVVNKQDLSSEKTYLGFESLTMVPIDLNLIEKSMLDKQEINWLNNYHAEVLKKLTPLLEKNQIKWLKTKTRRI